MLTALALALALATVSDVAIIAPELAKEHVGQEVVVLGKVAQVGESKDGHTLFLNFGERYPFHVFNAVIFRGSLQSFADARSWEGKVLRVRGKIQLYKRKGKPEIILERQEQVTIESDATRPQGAEPGGVLRAEGVVMCDVSGETPDNIPDEAGTREFDSPPRVVKQARPEYPRDAFDRRIEGTVLIEALVDTQGRVSRALVLQSVPLLDNAALQACCRWEFQPALKHGRPVATIIHMPVRFRIFGDEPKQRDQRPANSPQ